MGSDLVVDALLVPVDAAAEKLACEVPDETVLEERACTKPVVSGVFVVCVVVKYVVFGHIPFVLNVLVPLSVVRSFGRGKLEIHISLRRSLECCLLAVNLCLMIFVVTIVRTSSKSSN